MAGPASKHVRGRVIALLMAALWMGAAGPVLLQQPASAANGAADHHIGLATYRSEPGVPGFVAPMRQCFQVRPLPGHSNCVFTIYGTPSELESLRQLVQVMRDRPLGNGFDPGPTPSPNAQPVFDYLASVGWPVICYPGCADMQVKGGRCVLGPENEAVLAVLDRAGVFTAVQLGEWGYYFHNLSPNEPWWRDVYGKEFGQFKHLMKPPGLAGYDRRPTSRQECYTVLQDYFKSRSRDLLGRVISVTGHSHYEAYAGEWGARCIGLELGENIAFTQSKLAFARGASRQWRLPWSVQVSPWFAGACTTSGPLRQEGGGARGLDAGHSLSFCERMWLHAWFAGAAMVTPENSIAIFFEKPSAPWALTTHGRKAAEVFRFMQAHDRGVPFAPVAVVLDHLAGYNGYMDKPWGILEPTAGDRQVRDLFDHQLYPGSDHIHHRLDPANPESSYLRPTPYGEMFDVQLTSASAEMLSSYPVLLLVQSHNPRLGDRTHQQRRGRQEARSTCKHRCKRHRSGGADPKNALDLRPGMAIEPCLRGAWRNPVRRRPRPERLRRTCLPLNPQPFGPPLRMKVAVRSHSAGPRSPKTNPNPIPTNPQLPQMKTFSDFPIRGRPDCGAPSLQSVEQVSWSGDRAPWWLLNRSSRSTQRGSVFFLVSASSASSC
jgi:hypothetical protein